MRGFFESLIVFWKPDVEFISPLSINTCQNRLEDLGAKTSAGGWPWTPIDKIPIHFFLKGKDYSFWTQGPAISGTLQETEEGTNISATFWPWRPYWNIASLLILMVWLVFYLKDFFICFPLSIILVANVGYIYYFRSFWPTLEKKLTQNLKSWKRDI
ncbi:MAG TPA: hypothetical protein VIN60_01290 [Anaerolineales bacterium]